MSSGGEQPSSLMSVNVTTVSQQHCAQVEKINTEDVAKDILNIMHCRPMDLM